ncbi:MAG TPA: hypothetical protein PLU53_00895 [Bacteroidia bacterium]|nr:hypothetical protein [Bacteroidia bacterium]
MQNHFRNPYFKFLLKRLIIVLILSSISRFSFGQGVSGNPLKKVSKQAGNALITNFKEVNSNATIFGQAFSKAQLEALIKAYPDCNAFNVYFGFDKSGGYTGENQYMIMLAPAVLDTVKNTIKYVNDPEHDSSVYVPAFLCPDQCGLMQHE